MAAYGRGPTVVTLPTRDRVTPTEVNGMPEQSRERELLASSEHVSQLRENKITEFVKRVVAVTREGPVTTVGDAVWPAWPTWLEAKVEPRVRGLMLLGLADDVPLPDVVEAARRRPRVAPEQIASAFRLIATTLEDSEDSTTSRGRRNVLAWLVRYATAVGYEDTVLKLREWVCWLILRGMSAFDPSLLTHGELELVARDESSPLARDLLSVFGLSSPLTDDESRRAGAAEMRSTRAARGLPLAAALAAARGALSALAEHVPALALPKASEVVFMEEKEKFDRLTPAK
jgi:hypothetical protein